MTTRTPITVPPELQAIYRPPGGAGETRANRGADRRRGAVSAGEYSHVDVAEFINVARVQGRWAFLKPNHSGSEGAKSISMRCGRLKSPTAPRLGIAAKRARGVIRITASGPQMRLGVRERDHG